MSYPAGHIPQANDGIESLLAQIATSLAIAATAGDGQAVILAKIAAAATAAAAGQAAALAATDFSGLPTDDPHINGRMYRSGDFFVISNG